jgi:glycosyltransferase involved in cell wall biosynthesis
LTVSVDTDLFCAHPFDLGDGVLRVVYAGRLDAFKAPETMFATIAELARLLDGRIEFHYCGSGDPTTFAGFAPIARFTQVHGSLSSAQVAAVMERAHIGILTSHYEGMPCFLLEPLASGRPFGGVRLPQFAPLVEEGVSGRTTERASGEEATAQGAAQAIARLWGIYRTAK